MDYLSVGYGHLHFFRNQRATRFDQYPVFASVHMSDMSHVGWQKGKSDENEDKPFNTGINLNLSYSIHHCLSVTQEGISMHYDIMGVGVRVHPSGAKSFLVNYRAGNGGRKAANKRVVIGRVGRVTPDQARRLAQELLGRVAAGERTGAAPCRRWITPARNTSSPGTALRPPTGPIAVTRAAISATGSAPPRRHHPPGHREPLPPAYRSPRSGARQPVPVVPTLGLPQALRRSRGSAQSGGAVACRGRALPSQEKTADIVSGRGAAALASGYRGGCVKSRESQLLVVRVLHGYAPG